jgi:hypothetical protein
MNSTMWDVNIDRGDTAFLHDQLAPEIRRAIAEGEAAPGERLSLANDIAAALGVFDRHNGCRAAELVESVTGAGQ